ncbi:hypothetical protein SAMN05192559_1123 [Halobacillus karajensis]|uniref:Lipoprotein n=1 Tax=Halobacillus karajensis TaxID=195088 RepID=A0A024P882_9BACI|nr:hypothetical protein [Halobacillus karajensis]CDQ21233.1 hypothetical protein BN982_03599 [Halobacillus karajensis]CDQ25309.1 hypothetical protein BN983_03627 [Halobacillus karajensis]CDQ25968.1 hypothetical protein BN981_00175 [Halobacillus karajensis]SEI09955.1 hypothetical protein SAMN05192559_1123 [Halobacillus karajensis]
MNNRLVSGTLAFLFFLFLVGCSLGEEYVFEGESEHWESYIKVSESSGVKTEEFVVKYKGELKELSDIEEIQYSFEASKTSAKNTRTFGGEPPKQKEFSSSGSSLIGKDETIEVMVKWGENEETMELNIK